MRPQVIASNPQKPMADPLHCEGHIYSPMTDHSSQGQACHCALLNGKTRKGHRGIVANGSFTDMIDNLTHTINNLTSVYKI